jgi:hypothetical protein
MERHQLNQYNIDTIVFKNKALRPIDLRKKGVGGGKMKKAKL